MIDEKLLLDKIMSVTDDENDILEWCFFTLNEGEIASCLKDAKSIAAAELKADDGAALLTSMFVKVIVRALRWTRLERQRERSKVAPEEAVPEGPLVALAQKKTQRRAARKKAKPSD